MAEFINPLKHLHEKSLKLQPHERPAWSIVPTMQRDFFFFFLMSRGRQHFDVCDYHGENDQRRNSPHGHVSQQLHQLVPAGTSNTMSLTSNTRPVFEVKHTVVWFQVKEPDCLKETFTSRGKRRRMRIPHKPWPRWANACDTSTGPAPSASAWPHKPMSTLNVCHSWSKLDSSHMTHQGE